MHHDSEREPDQGGGSGHGERVQPERKDDEREPPEGPPADIPIGAPVPAEELRRLKEAARRPGADEPPATEDPSTKED